MIGSRYRSRFGRAVSGWSPAPRYGAALLIVLVTTGLIALISTDWLFFGHITIENPSTIYIAAITLVALLTGYGPALVAAAASMLALFLAFSRYESFERAVVLAATILVIIGLVEWQRRAQAAAERAEAKFAAIVESMSDAVMVVDAAGRSTDVNRAAITMLGAVDRSDALAKITHRRADGTPATGEYALLERALGGEESAWQDIPIPDAPDGPRVVGAVAGPMRDARGRIIGAVSVSRDLTDRLIQEREREALLRRIEQEQQFTAQVLANAPVGIAVIRADDFALLSFNAEYDASIRHAPGSRPLAIGQSLLDAMPAASHDAATRLLSRARDERTTIRSTAYFSAVAPDQFYDGTIQSLRLSDGTPALLITAINVTERVRGEREREALIRLVEERRQFAQAIFDTAPTSLAVVDTDAMTFSAANPAFVASTPEPYRSHGVNDCAVAAVLHHAAENGFIGQLRSVGRTGAPIETVATRYLHPTRGATFWNETMIPLTTSDPTAHYVLYIAADVTQEVAARRQAVILAREAAERANQLDAVIANMPDGVAIYAPDGRLLQMNTAGRQIAGEDPEADETVSAAVERFKFRYLDGRPIPLDDLPLSRSLRGETVSSYEFVGRSRRGDAYLLSGSAPIRDAEGAITSAVVTFTDITERKQAERERERLLREVEDRRQFAQTVIDSAPAGIAVCAADADFTVLLANDRFRSIVGDVWSEPRLEGVPFHAFTPNAETAGILPIFRRVAETGEPVSLSEFEYAGSGGEPSYLDWSLVPLRAGGDGVTSLVLLVSDVTDRVLSRQRIEELADAAALRAAELEAIIANMPDGVAIYGADGQLMQMNAAGHAISGEDLSPDDALPDVVERFDLRYPDGRVIPLDDLPLPRALRGETVSGYEFVRRTRRGDTTILMGSVPIRDAAGRIASAVVIFSDITERRAAEQQREQLLREIDERRRFVQTVLESAPVGIAAFGTDADLTARMANDQYLQLLEPSWRAGGIIGHGLREFIPGADAAGLAALVQQALDRAAPVVVREFAFNGFARGTGHFDASIVPLQESGAEITGILTVVADVTERVETRRRIEDLAWDAAQRASELETVIASIADGVIVTDAEGRIVLENAASRRLTGRAQSAVSFDLDAQVAEQGLRNPDGTSLPPDDLPLGRAVRGETVTEQVLIVRRADTGEDRFLICSSAPVRAGSGAITGAVAVFRDITEMKQLDQMKDEFISIAAHELRTPLTAIKGYAELLDRRLSTQAGRESDRRSLGVIRKQTERLAGLVNEMLDVSRIEAGRLELNIEPFDLAALVGEVVGSMRISSDAHRLALAAEPGIEVQGDTARIEQVLINLISNAVTYAPEGGDVDIRAWAEGDAALVSVRDRGVGIAPDELPHLFDRFYRAPRAGVMRSGGMGLGLYICREIVARHGGTIRAESAEGAGSTFTFSLPLAGKD